MKVMQGRISPVRYDFQLPSLHLADLKHVLQACPELNFIPDATKRVIQVSLLYLLFAIYHPPPSLFKSRRGCDCCLSTD